jgi:glyoxylase-like metal-dependent hydrolase (beta-lactamase superfamily II)/rhodanese-related sulfurtransferase
LLLEQFYLGCLAHASYLIGDEGTRVAAVVDPQRDIDRYVQFAQEHGLDIKHVILTHFHADFVAGHLEIRDRLGATIYLGKTAKAEYAFTPLGDDDAMELGQVRLVAMETPGHTVESISLVVYDRTVSETVPRGVLTGDTLFVGDVGRPDLRVALGWSAAALGGMLYDSLHQKLLSLPDDTAVYPAHGAGSLCGKAISQERTSTIGNERRSNYALQPMTKAAFIDLVTSEQMEAPDYFTYDAVLNTKELPSLGHTLARELTPLPLERVLELQQAGAEVIDTREPTEYAAAHLAGSVNLGLGGQYASWAGTILKRDRPIVLIADPGRERESALRLARIGLDQVAGCLEGGLVALDKRSGLVRTTERLSASVAADRLREAHAPFLLDIRSPGEVAQKRIAESVSIPLGHLLDQVDRVPRDRPVLVYCAGGYRSSIASSLLQRAGHPDVSEIAGGLNAWEAAGLPLAGPPQSKRSHD